MEGEKEKEKNGKCMFVQTNSYEKYYLVKRRELTLKMNASKQEYFAQLESMRGRL